MASVAVAGGLNSYGVQSDNPYVVRRFVQDGKEMDEVIVPGRPPEYYRAPEVVILKSNAAAGIQLLSNVPAFDYSYGCSATSAAMMFGYYDNIGYPNLYTGPANGGVCPMTNAVWGSGECPLSATHKGIDGRLTRGHVDDYWIAYGSTATDPYIGNWTEHTQGECAGDFMGTNQSLKSNFDGSTTFTYYSHGSPLYDYIPADTSRLDGCHGMRLFFESRGYTVSSNYSQYIYGYNGNTEGFTFENYKQEIDAGRPVLIQVDGHTMLGYGYDDLSSTVYLHDTWDYGSHTMTWGGSYSGMRHYAVTVFVPSPAPLNSVLSVTPSSQNVAKGAGEAGFSVSNSEPGTMPWTAEVISGGDWLRITSGGSGTDAGTIVCAFDENTATIARTGTIRVTATGATGTPKDVTVTQAENTPLSLMELSIDGPASVNENGTGTYAATAGWSEGSTSTVTPDWSEDSAYASISADGVLTTTEVAGDQAMTITASYTSGGVTMSAIKSVMIRNMSLNEFSTVQKLFIGYYLRPAAPAGLVYWAWRWADEEAKPDGNIKNVIEAFSNTPESQAIWGGITEDTIDTFINKAFQSLFGRDAAPYGLNFYHTGFTNGTFTPGTIVYDIFVGAPEGSHDKAVLDKKLAFANAFTAILEQNPDDNPLNDQATYKGQTDAAIARAMLAAVGEYTVIDPAAIKQQIMDQIADPGDPILN